VLAAAGVNLSKVNITITEYADVWMRDYGPIFLKNQTTNELAWVKWVYNAYGKKFPDLLKDNEVFLKLRTNIDKRMFETGIVMEGGAVELNGQGTLITTEQCLLNPNRNPRLTKEEIETYLKDFYGVKNIVWLKEGIINDHTDGHVDDCVKFVDASTIICAYEENENNPNYNILKNNYEALTKSLDQKGQPFKLIKLPMPHVNYEDGSLAPASYINFYIGNKTVLVPTFEDPNDSKALAVIQECFPERQVVGINSVELINGGGTIHCITQQQPL
jgi:agmatine deiminase